MGYHSELVGKDIHSPSREQVINKTGATINRLVCVAFINIDQNTGFISVKTAGKDDIIRGIMEENIDNQQISYMITEGRLVNIDTSSFNAGDLLYRTDSGMLSKTVNGSALATVLHAHNKYGVLYVHAGLGGAGGSPDNFSYHIIDPDQTVTIPRNQQMIVAGKMDIHGTLITKGQLVKIK